MANLLIFTHLKTQKALKLIDPFENSNLHEIKLDKKLQELSKIPLDRMLMYASGQDIQKVFQYKG